MRKCILFLFLLSCSSPNSNYNVNDEVLDFEKKLTFEEFNNLLIKYSKKNPYPDIDQ